MMEPVRRQPPGVAADELYEAGRQCATSMRFFAIIGGCASTLLILMAFVVISVDRQSRMVALGFGLPGLALGASALFLREASNRFEEARRARTFAIFARAVAFETAFWRIIAAIGVVAFALTWGPSVFASLFAVFLPSPAAKSVVDMRNIGAALERYAASKHQYPDVKTVEDLAIALRPFMTKSMPTEDGWGTKFRYKVSCHEHVCYDYRLASGGADRRFEEWALTIEDNADYVDGVGGGIRRPETDIVFGSGHFIVMPANLRRPDD